MLKPENGESHYYTIFFFAASLKKEGTQICKAKKFLIIDFCQE